MSEKDLDRKFTWSTLVMIATLERSGKNHIEICNILGRRPFLYFQNLYRYERNGLYYIAKLYVFLRRK